MISKHALRLTYVLLSLCGLAAVISLVLYSLRQNINLFYTPEQLCAAVPRPKGRIRVGGMLKEIIATDGLQIDFIVTDYKQDITVKYVGVLPDLFKQGQGVVVLGKLTAPQQFMAEQVLAKHDEKYMPPQLMLTQE